jgi:hypothetical protein
MAVISEPLGLAMQNVAWRQIINIHTLVRNTVYKRTITNMATVLGGYVQQMLCRGVGIVGYLTVLSMSVLYKVLYWHLPGGTEKNNEKCQPG